MDFEQFKQEAVFPMQLTLVFLVVTSKPFVTLLAKAMYKLGLVKVVQDALCAQSELKVYLLCALIFFVAVWALRKQQLLTVQ